MCPALHKQREANLHQLTIRRYQFNSGKRRACVWVSGLCAKDKNRFALGCLSSAFRISNKYIVILNLNLSAYDLVDVQFFSSLLLFNCRCYARKMARSECFPINKCLLESHSSYEFVAIFFIIPIISISQFIGIWPAHPFQFDFDWLHLPLRTDHRFHIHLLFALCDNRHRNCVNLSKSCVP